MKEVDILSDRIVSLFESYMVYLSPSLNLSEFAKLLEVEEAFLERYFREEVEYSFEEMLQVFRVTHASDLRTKEGVPYEELWKCSGFKSFEDFEMALQKLAIK